MNLSYLGDALDHWKGSLLETLQRNALVDRFAVDPMASDLSSWVEEDFALFARLLRVRREQVLHHRASLAQRGAYFGEITHEGDLFLDADTGIATGSVGRPEQYVMPREVNDLLRDTRMLVVYQHVRAQRVRARVDTVLAALFLASGAASWCSYESGTVALLFLSRTAGRTSAVAGHFRANLGRHAAGRIRDGTLGAPA